MNAEGLREGVLYCRAAHRRSPEQFGVDQREAACHALAQDSGVRVAARHVFIDPLSTSWSRDRIRPTWQGLIAAAENADVTDLLLFDAPELQRHHPWDFAHLLGVADRRGLTLLDPAGSWELNGRAERRALVEQTGQLCLRREASSERMRFDGGRVAEPARPHGGGRRAYGYTAGTYDLVPFEASVVAQIFTWFIEGRSFTGIATELNRLRIETAYGSSWSASGVRRIIDAPRYAGLRVVRGQPARAADGSYLFGNWKPCVALEVWEAAQALRRAQAEQDGAEARRNGESRHYPLTGLVQCALCGRGMVGSMVEGFPTYACTGNNLVAPERCSQHVSAARLEELVDHRIVAILERLDPALLHQPSAACLVDVEAGRRRTMDQARLAELHAMRRPPADELARLVARIREVNRLVVVRAGDALDDLSTGRRASAGWRRLSLARRAEVRRFLIARIRIGAVTGPRSVFDPSRVEMVPNPW